ncbi:hypothetical protein [Streptomyces sp. NBC_01408]|uniref:hypothetical protein n=1 Tax=Streptomyces sp. NBC_01408 TaxID=2903855 RepID=UPI00224EE81B|nr:hypothetical protein [Streptomyces sp. NBC_01408]MCX4692249.1 hypothetical protein [Streptomyces sp. NBC_01408]
MSTWRTWHRPLVVFALVMAVWALGSAVGLLVDDRVLTGAPIWAKPFKFSVSFVAYCLSLAWMISLLGEARPRLRRTAWWAGTVVVAASAGEMVLITLQAVRGVRSHFNNATPFDAQVYALMRDTVIVLWLGTLVVAILLSRARTTDRATAWSIRISTVLALIGAALAVLMTLPTAEQQRLDTAGLEVLENGAHSVGVSDGGPGMFLTGWSTTGGDLRIPHFFGMHALQLLPLLVLVLAALAPRFARLRDERVRVRLVFVAGSVYAAVLALLTWQALRGQPLIHPDGATLGAAAAILLTAGLGTAAALLGRAAPVEEGHGHAGGQVVAGDLRPHRQGDQVVRPGA